MAYADQFKVGAAVLATKRNRDTGAITHKQGVICKSNGIEIKVKFPDGTINNFFINDLAIVKDK